MLKHSLEKHYTTHSANSWTTKNTRINATALFIDDSGSPQSGKTVTFNLYMPNGTEYTAAKINATTNAYGLANFSFDMDARAYYGNWTVKASNSSLNDSTRFIYNWWGCGISGCESGHSSENPSGSLTINSPYYNGRENPSWGDHNTACTNCHQSFDGQPGGLSTGGTGHTNYASDVHRNITCDNANCHQSNSIHGSTGAVIGSCYSAACHRSLGTPANRSDISNKSTLSGVLSIYSSNNGSTFNSTFHTPNSTVPCFTCHGPMHNITKPDESTRFIKNTDTESSQCTTCHTTYSQHNNGVNCTVCHSDDVHAIKVFAQNATYVTLNHNSPNPARGNCTNCHQNATFFTLLTNTTRNPKAGSYSGANPPQVQILLNHSSDNSGQKWGSFWTTPVSACDYCHGSTQHETSALGTVSTALGSESVGAPISTGTVCSSCHNSADSDYDVVMLLSPVPPSNIPGINYPISGGMDHTGYVTDADCKNCHGSNLKTGDTMSNFSHNVAPSSGEGGCLTCHSAQLDTTNFGVHRNINNTDGGLNDSDCKACHFNISSMGSGYVAQPGINVYNCTNCHTGAGQFGAPLVSEHNENGTDVITAATCTICHSNSGMYLPNSGANGTSTAISHYIKDVTNPATSPYQHNGTINTSNCIDCHNGAYTNNASWGSPVNISISSNRPHSETLTSECDVYHKDINIASLALVDFHNASVQKASTSNCVQCHTSYVNAVNNSMHNQTKNAGAPTCTGCHTNYDTNEGHNDFVVNETNTCRTCHVEGVNLNESHGNLGYGQDHADCTTCHFANTTKKFDRNNALFTHDHNLTVEYNYYNYNLSGIPLSSNGGIGKGMFPYYTCTLTCHNGLEGGEPKLENETLAWSHSGHAKASSHATKYNGSCLKCHSPPMYNASNGANLSTSDVQGIQCRVCHNLHNDTYSGNNLAFYNSTLSSVSGSAVYDQVSTATELCEKCHAGGQHYNSRDISYSGDHKSVLGFTCANCHMNSSLNTGGEHSFEINNTATGLTGCEACHDPTEVHTSNFSEYWIHDSSVTCDACHDGTFVKNSTNYVVNVSTGKVFGSIWKNPSTNKWTTYRGTGTPTDWTFHNITKQVTCDKCHGGISVKSGAIAPLLGEGTGCLMCHITEVDTANFGVHQNINNTDGGLNDSDCTTCHYNTSNMGDRYVAQPGINVYDCAECHTGTGNFSAPLVAEHNQNGTDVITSSANCTLCHSNAGMYLENSGANGTSTAISHYIKEVTNLSTSPYLHNGTIDTSNCILCHNGAYTNNASWGNPVNISTSSKRTHTETLTSQCDTCHMDGNVSSLTLVDFHASVQAGSTDNCLSCHDIGGSSVAKIDNASIGMHRNVNNTDGGLTNTDCKTCHFNITGMGTGYLAQPGVNVYTCKDCHVNQNVTSPVVSEHYPGATVNVTTMECENCHSNSLNIPDPASTVNTTIGNVTHYGTTTNLVKPTAGTYNTACNICHNSATNKTIYGVQNKQVTMSHTSAGTCDECHVNSSNSADTLHNMSLEMPVDNGCLVCHTTYADKYGAPNLIGTPMAGWTTTCRSNSQCHGTIGGIISMDTLAKHNVDMTYAGTGGSTDTVYLNNQVSLTVTKGVLVNITSRVNDAYVSGGASRIGGAEYYIDVDPGQGKGIPMGAVDGYYNALQNNWENVTATIDTSNLTGGAHLIYVRGVDIGKQWSAPKNATLIVQAFGYINGTVTNGSAPVIGAYVSTTNANYTTGADGNYSLMVSDGNYTVNASKQPEFYDYTVSGKIVTPLNTTIVDIVMDQKPTGTISGGVRNF